MRSVNIVERARVIEDRAAELRAMGLAAQPTEMHRQAFRVLKDLLAMGRDFSSDATPAHLRALLRTLDKMEPMFLEEMAKVPSAPFKLFLADLVARLQTVIDAPD